MNKDIRKGRAVLIKNMQKFHHLLEESEGYALETLYNDYCDCYEERED